jgi:uncharacterized protein YjbI with pentapeptide repeats
VKVCKPLKIPILTRVVEVMRRPHFHVGAIIPFSLTNSRALLGEFAFWTAVAPEIGPSLFDEGIAKSRAELLVAGRCFVRGGQPVPASFVRVRLGPIDKRLAVIGDRHYERLGVASEPKPFTEMPIDWHHAYGGKSYARNPYGIGVEDIERDGRRVRPLPNIEPWGDALGSRSDEADGFLPMDMSFEQRRARAGTFGRDYVDKYAPGLPPDHDAVVFNAARHDQWVDGFWRGHESFLVENMSPTSPRLEGRLPGLTARAFATHRTPEGDRFVEIDLRADTVWLFPSAGIGAVISHGSMAIADDDARDIVHLVVACEEPCMRRPSEHYAQALGRRLDKDKGAIGDLSDSDLMPPRESGVTPNMDLGPIGQWVRPELISAANARRGAERWRQERRNELIAAGIDPAGSGLAEPLPPIEIPPMDDFDAVAEYILAMESRVAEEEEAAKQAGDELRAEHRASFAASGRHVDEQLEEVTSGPPTFRAEAHYRHQLELARAARKAGMPLTDVDEKLRQPEYREELERLEEMTRESYRQGAHLMPTAPPMTEQASQIARVLVEAARSVEESLAGHDLTGADLHELDLSGLDFRGAFLAGADLRGANLSGARFEGAVLAKADLRGARLDHAKLSGANLGGATFAGASLDDADLSNAVMMGARLGGARFERTCLSDADLLEVQWSADDLSDARLDGCTFIHADLSDVKLRAASLVRATFVECTLHGVDFTNANLHKATFVSCRGKGVQFVGARLHEAVLSHQNELPDANFRDALLEKCCLRTTAIVGACFERARMSMADLSECDARHAVFDQASLPLGLLIRTILDHASLRGVNLTEAILSKATMAGTDFTGAQLTRADFSRARGDDKTRFTDAVLRFTRFDREGSRPAS